MAQERAKMPVVNVTVDRLKKFVPGVKVDRALDMLPFVALDIEGADDNIIRIEYNPNRPDFSSDYGIARALRGLLGIETGLPKFRMVGRSGLAIRVDPAVRRIRPHIVALVARNGKLGDETIRQLIAMQEDLHNGVGRRRKKASIGIHNLDAIKFPISYRTAGGDYSFVPLGESTEQSIDQILKESDTGKQYGHILAGSDRYPIISDSAGTVLSFPPIINGNATKVDESCRNLFVEVTATDQKAAEDTLAIVAATLYDAGFDIRTVTIGSGKKIETPQMKPWIISADIGYLNSILGLALDAKQAIRCLKKSRLDARASGRKIICTVPRYRTDISHAIDIAEEVAIGYGIFNLEPTLPASPTAGQKNSLSTYFDAIREALTGLGMLESLSFSLTSMEVQYGAFGIAGKNVLSVDGSKSIEHEILRDSLVPSLLQSLSHNVHEGYPQRLFEIGKTFHKDNVITESWNIVAAVAHADAGYTEIKSAMQALLKSCFGKDVSTKASTNPMFMEGRCAEIIVDGRAVGMIGEITPLALENFKLRVPVAAFEIDLSSIIKDK
ncbi:MAG TPA: phenylalanine--tRNA ligase subunit beta [Nitrososphaera sp.]|nr:phenylalanine--tRNA ligase subunit beta [Nitrososphaera sp.]